MATDAGFSDNYPALEEFIKTYFAIVKKYKLTNTNSIQTNYPAIDLIDDANKVVIQVSATALTRKINQTVDKWIALKKQNYQLVIVGVTAKSRSTKATVYTLGDLVREAKKLRS